MKKGKSTNCTLKNCITAFKHTALPVMFAVSFCFYGTTFAKIIFTDNFESEATSYQNWIPVCAHENLLTFGNQHLIMDNQDPTYCAFAVREIKTALPEFTFSASIEASSPGAGLFFCIEDSGSYYIGNAVILADNEILFMKYDSSSAKVTARIETPFIKPLSNDLQISKKDSLCNVFCNGYFCGSFTLSSSGTYFALMVQPSIKATFDNISIEDIFKDSLQSKPFHDDFCSANNFGWSVIDFAQNSRTDSSLVVKTGKNQSFFSYVPIPLGDFSVKSILTPKNDSSSSLFGIFLRVKKSDSISDFLFGINNSSYLSEFYDTESGIPSAYENMILANGQNPHEKFTLEIKRTNGSSHLSINGNMQKSCTITEEIIGAGIFAIENLELHVHEFSIETFYTPETKSKLFTKTVKRPRVQTTTRYHDLLGRPLSESAHFKNGKKLLVKPGIKKLAW
ncbi:MAG: hypothetical protein Q4F84_00680 [Fibrobacter sp.]|nr:hypothetical protein [Fibrobacter sp.]